VRSSGFRKFITMNKARGGDGKSAELFQILKDHAVKVLHSICQQIWKTQQWPQEWKMPVFIPIPKKGDVNEYSICHEVIGPDSMIFVFFNVEFQDSFFTLLFKSHQDAL